MSLIQKNPKTTAKKKMITRRQITDVIAYGQIITDISHAKRTQIFLEKLITSSKNKNLSSIRKAHSIILRNKKFTKDELINKLFSEISNKYKNRPGGYSRVLKTEKGALLQLV